MQATRAEFVALREQITQARQRSELVRKLWLAPGGDRLQYSPYARLVARLASMPRIEQAKGILMAQCGWTAEQAFDALRDASQRSNVKVRDLASRIVASAAAPAGHRGRPEPGRPAVPGPHTPVRRAGRLRPVMPPARGQETVDREEHAG